MASEFWPTDFDGAMDIASASMMYCSVCFDVEEEDGVVEEGTDGIGSCFYKVDDEFYFDAEYTGTVEALGSDSFSFKEASKNNWDWDQSGYVGSYSYFESSTNPMQRPQFTTYFVSLPLDVNKNSKKHLGISKGETYW